MKLLMIAFVALAILGGGAAGAYFYFAQPANASVGQAPAHTEAKEVKKDHGGDHGKKKSFVELDPLILPIVDETGVSQVVSIVVVIEAAGTEEAQSITNLQPKLKDAYIQQLYGVLNKKSALKDGVVQVGMIKSRLSDITHVVLGEGMANDVLLQVVQQRPM